MSTPALFHRLLDDAATFPPGNVPLDQALRAHRAHLHAETGDLLGPLVVAGTSLPLLARFVVGQPIDSLHVSVTVASPGAARAACTTLRAIGAAHLAALEVTLPADLAAADVVPALAEAIGEPGGVDVYVELPRDERRPHLVEALAATSYRAKLRTGGLEAAMHPGEAELADAITALVRAGVAFKATAGLHHAVRRTDPATGFEQHGFLNVLVATDAARRGGGSDEVRSLLAERDATRLAGLAGTLDPEVRRSFCSFGTCSIDEPVADLRGLGLLAPADPGVLR